MNNGGHRYTAEERDNRYIMKVFGMNDTDGGKSKRSSKYSIGGKTKMSNVHIRSNSNGGVQRSFSLNHSSYNTFKMMKHDANGTGGCVYGDLIDSYKDIENNNIEHHINLLYGSIDKKKSILSSHSNTLHHPRDIYRVHDRSVIQSDSINNDRRKRNMSSSDIDGILSSHLNNINDDNNGIKSNQKRYSIKRLSDQNRKWMNRSNTTIKHNDEEDDSGKDKEIIHYIDNQMYKNNKVIKKLNEYLKDKSDVSDTLLDYKEKLIEFHYKQIKDQLTNKMNQLDYHELFGNDKDRDVEDKKEMISAFLLGFSHNTRYKKFCKQFKSYLDKNDIRTTNRIGIIKGLVSVSELWDENLYKDILKKGDYHTIRHQYRKKFKGAKVY